RVGLFDKPDDLLGAESALLHVRPLGFTDFIASAGTAQWGQVTFDEASDIDVAIVSPELFAAIWHEVLDMKAGGAFIKDIQGFQHYHFQGWMRPDKMPASSTYHRCRDWWEFFLSLSKKEEYDRRPIRGGLYYDTSFLSRYQTTALAQIQRQISKSNP
ncbi:hypothetical protein WAF95_22285, partial [Xanthomonas perforans]